MLDQDYWEGNGVFRGVLGGGATEKGKIGHRKTKIKTDVW